MTEFSNFHCLKPSGTPMTPQRSISQKPCILVAEDHEDTRLLLRLYLENRGFDVLEAGDGEEALRVIESSSPDLVLLDGSLPSIDGFALTRRLRARGEGVRLPIVFLSGHAEPFARAEAFAAGCDDYLVKPDGLSRLEGVLSRYLGGTRRVLRTDEGGVDVIAQTPVGEKLYGLLELDAAGTVLYSRLETDGAGPAPKVDLSGLNFFEEVAPFSNVQEFRRHVNIFVSGDSQAGSFDFDCQYEDGLVQVRVLLARLRERSRSGVTKSVLVHLRKKF